MKVVAVFLVAQILVSLAFSSDASKSAVSIPGGRFTPLYGFGKKEKREYQVAPFYVDRVPVTRKKFHQFVLKHSEWSKSKVDSIYADKSYLNGLILTEKTADLPITHISWFAAQAYCETMGGRLPTVLEWEFIAAASETKADATRDPVFVDQILKWYSKPTNNRGSRKVGAEPANYYGVQDLHGLIWEWTADFNSVFVSGDNRQDGDKSMAAVCGAGATDASNRSDYAAFMRYAMRSSVEARFSQANLGFRCAYDKKGEFK